MQYLNIHMKDEKAEIGIIQVANKGKLKGNSLKRKLESSLDDGICNALEKHFDCPIKIVSVDVVKFTPLEMKAYVLIESLDEDHYEDVVLKETWLY
jgi:hypothetical protein